jgi:hypothetical protein
MPNVVVERMASSIIFSKSSELALFDLCFLFEKEPFDFPWFDSSEKASLTEFCLVVLSVVLDEFVSFKSI